MAKALAEFMGQPDTGTVACAAALIAEVQQPQDRAVLLLAPCPLLVNSAVRSCAQACRRDTGEELQITCTVCWQATASSLQPEQQQAPCHRRCMTLTCCIGGSAGTLCTDSAAVMCSSHQS